MEKALKRFIIIGLVIAAIFGHINVLNTAEKGGWMFATCVGIQLFVLLWGLRVAKRLGV